jgi:P27 family predicted phage terminase small subunit
MIAFYSLAAASENKGPWYESNPTQQIQWLQGIGGAFFVFDASRKPQRWFVGHGHDSTEKNVFLFAAKLNGISGDLSGPLSRNRHRRSCCRGKALNTKNLTIFPKPAPAFGNSALGVVPPAAPGAANLWRLAVARPRLTPVEMDLKGARPQHTRASNPAFEAGRPTMPKDLTGAARAEWKRLCRELMRRGTGTKLDAGILELHCQTYQRWRACLAEIGDKLFIDVPVTDANGIFLGMKRKPNPALAIAQKCEATLKHTLAALGATPASRRVSQMTASGRLKNEPPKPGTAAAMLAAAEGE